jgi:hypothetical protein
MRQFFLLLSLIFSDLIIPQAYSYYFGNLHSHTGFSDGNKDSITSGVSKPDGSYTYAKLSQDFDFLGISEHNHYSANHNPGFKLPRYQIGLNMANNANQDGTFLALFGMEFGVSSSKNGHVIIYGFNQLIGWETAVPGVIGNNYDIFNAKNDYAGLFKKVKDNPNAFCYLAHPYWTDFSLDGTESTALAFSPYNAMFDSAIVGMPFRSGQAFSTFDNYSDYPTGDNLMYFKKLLYIGYHLGIGYDHDNHNTNFGRSNGGRLVILAPTLTRVNLGNAMQQMHFYGSDDPNAKVEFTMDGNIMGSIVKGNFYPTFNVKHNDPDGELADSIKIWKGHSNGGGLWAELAQLTVGSNTSTYCDTNIISGTEYYYFSEIKQKDGQTIATSPIWYTATSPLSVNDNGRELKLIYFPNPVSETLSLSFPQCDDYRITIQDLSGRPLFEARIFEKDLSVDLSNIARGIYLLNVKSKTSGISRKLVVE